MKDDSRSRIALITGASSGIGAATAEALADAGMHVALVARRDSRLADLEARINDTHGAHRARRYAADVTDPQTIGAVITQVIADFGGLDVLVNAAGVGHWAPARQAVLADWHAMVDVNINGVLNTTHAALDALCRAADEHGIADIVAISSVAGRRVPGINSNVYSASKHAVNAFCEALRQELAETHVRVGLIEPGIVTTEMTTTGEPHAPDARDPSGLGYLAPEDIAEAVVYMTTRRAPAAVNEITIRPTEQVR